MPVAGEEFQVTVQTPLGEEVPVTVTAETFLLECLRMAGGLAGEEAMLGSGLGMGDETLDFLDGELPEGHGKEPWSQCELAYPGLHTLGAYGIEDGARLHIVEAKGRSTLPPHERAAESYTTAESYTKCIRCMKRGIKQLAEALDEASL